MISINYNCKYIDTSISVANSSNCTITHFQRLHKANRFTFLLCNFQKREEKGAFIACARGQKYHVLKFYFVALDGVDRRYVNAKRGRQKKKKQSWKREEDE